MTQADSDAVYRWNSKSVDNHFCSACGCDLYWDGKTRRVANIARLIDDFEAVDCPVTVIDGKHLLTLAFDPQDTVASQTGLNGDHWEDWLASSCPALLIGGCDSRVTNAAHVKQMASRRSNTHLVTLKGGHVAHFDNLAAAGQVKLSSATSA